MTADRASNVRLIVFSDDWGRHPSSCQHLTRRLLLRYRTLWVNTVGTRAPRLSREDLGKGFVKLRQWLSGSSGPRDVLPDNLEIVTPPMYPGFRRRWQRRLNRRLVASRVHRTLGSRAEGERRVVVTTIAVTADLVDALDVDRWVYYCVDDFSVWPGLDGPVLEAMERELVGRVDRVICVSETLEDRLANMGSDPVLLTHGTDLAHWQAAPSSGAPQWLAGLDRPVLLFWGVIDRRLDYDMCAALAREGSLVLVGPDQSPDPRLESLPGVRLPGPADFDALPALAAAADVLVMPYADLPVTRAMQPLKFKEYLATGRPVVVPSLPAMRPWRDTADVVETREAFVEAVRRRIAEGVPDDQARARLRLADESWDRKAEVFEEVLLGE
ncbi:MAG: hypothetical protein CMJ18_09075 [Phycisphaeraceae bacterium]|nr:hypothetical protein [Phycisphaeraceae bacterium]